MPSTLHDFENDGDGDMVVTNAITGANDATATVKVKRTVHIATHNSSGHRDMAL